MNCPKCGAALEDVNSPCPNCGKKMTQREIKIEKMLSKKRNEKQKHKVTFFSDVAKAYGNFWLRIFDVKTMDTIKDFWYPAMVNFIIAVVLIIVYHWVGITFLACTAIPLITNMIRRIKDSGRNWYYIFLAFLPGAGPVLLVILLCLPSYYKVKEKNTQTKK